MARHGFIPCRALFFLKGFGLISPPEIGSKENKYGKKLQPAHQHEKGKKPFAQPGNMRIIVHWPHTAEPGAYISKGGHYCADGSLEIQTEKRHHQAAGKEGKEIDQDKSTDVK